jgi:protein-disulfide isomerase
VNLQFPVDGNDHAKGSPDAAVTIVEYGDYECPFCRASEPIVEALDQALGSNLRLVFRHFPVTNLHPHAERAAETAEAAGAQGKFWEIHRILFANQEALEDADLRRYADSLGLDMQRYDAEMEEHIYRHKVRQDLLEGLQTGVRGTPTFFIDGERLDGPPDLQEMLRLVRQKHPELEDSVTRVPIQIRVPAVTRHQP